MKIGISKFKHIDSTSFLMIIESNDLLNEFNSTPVCDLFDWHIFDK